MLGLSDNYLANPSASFRPCSSNRQGQANIKCYSMANSSTQVCAQVQDGTFDVGHMTECNLKKKNKIQFKEFSVLTSGNSHSAASEVQNKCMLSRGSQKEKGIAMFRFVVYFWVPLFITDRVSIIPSRCAALMVSNYACNRM